MKFEKFLYMRSSVYLNIKMMKMAKWDARRALMVLPCGNAFSAQKTYRVSILDRKTSNFGQKCPKMAFLAILDPKFLSSKLMLYHMGGPTDLTDDSK